MLRSTCRRTLSVFVANDSHRFQDGRFSMYLPMLETAVLTYRSGTMHRTNSFRKAGIVTLIGRLAREILCFQQILPCLLRFRQFVSSEGTLWEVCEKANA